MFDELIFDDAIFHVYEATVSVSQSTGGIYYEVRRRKNKSKSTQRVDTTKEQPLVITAANEDSQPAEVKLATVQSPIRAKELMKKLQLAEQERQNQQDDEEMLMLILLAA